MTRVWLDIDRIKRKIQVASEDALEDVGDFVAADARRRAPIRKAFKEKAGFKRRFRALTPLERALATRRAQNFYTNIQPNEFKRARAVAHIRNYGRAEVPRRGSANSLRNSRKARILGYSRRGRFSSTSGAFPVKRGFEPGPTLGPMLTARGKYEVRSGRAVHRHVLASGAMRLQIGGALKASIGSEGVSQTPSGAQVKITAGIRYAKFVEFPTIRTASQPFLLPALHDARSRLKRTLARELNRQFGG
jgi:hypothetical protein